MAEVLVEIFGQLQVSVADGLAVYRDSQVLLVDGERNMVPFPVENLRLALDGIIAGVGVDSAMDCGADELGILLALGNFQSQRVRPCGENFNAV